MLCVGRREKNSTTFWVVLTRQNRASPKYILLEALCFNVFTQASVDTKDKRKFESYIISKVSTSVTKYYIIPIEGVKRV